MIPSGIVDGALAFAEYAGLVLVLLRLASRTEPAKIVTLGAPCVLVVHGTGIVLTGAPVNLWVFAVTYSYLALTFLMVFGAVYKSVSLRMLTWLLEQPGNSAAYDTILNHFLIGHSFGNRMALIVDKGYATMDGDRYALTSRGHTLAGRTQALQRIFGIQRSG